MLPALQTATTKVLFRTVGGRARAFSGLRMSDICPEHERDSQVVTDNHLHKIMKKIEGIRHLVLREANASPSVLKMSDVVRGKSSKVVQRIKRG